MSEKIYKKQKEGWGRNLATLIPNDGIGAFKSGFKSFHGFIPEIALHTTDDDDDDNKKTNSGN